MRSKLTQDDFMSHNPFYVSIMEIIAGRVCQMMSKGALLAAGQQRNACDVSNLKINLPGVGKKRQNPQGLDRGWEQQAGTIQGTPVHAEWDGVADDRWMIETLISYFSLFPVPCPGCGISQCVGLAGQSHTHTKKHVFELPLLFTCRGSLLLDPSALSPQINPGAQTHMHESTL